jgi:hypothetical protein
MAAITKKKKGFNISKQLTSDQVFSRTESVIDFKAAKEEYD